MLSRPQPFGKEMHFKDFWNVLKDNAWIITSFFLVIVSTVAIVSFSKTPLYEAKTRILIKSRLTPVLPTTGGGVEDSVAPQTAYDLITFFNSQRLIVESTSLAEYTLKNFPELMEHPHLKNAKQPAQVLRSKLRTQQVERTHIMDLYVVDIDPVWAATIANKVAEAYSTYNMETMRQSTERVYSMLRDKLNRVYKDYKDSRETMVGVAEEEALYSPEDVSRINDSSLTVLGGAYSEARRERIRLQTLLDQIQAVSRRGGNLLEIRDVADDPVISDLHRQLTQKQVEMVNMRTSLKESHPEVVMQKASIVKIGDAFQAEVDKFVERVRNRYQEILTQEKRYADTLEEIKKNSADVKRRTIEYDALESQVQITSDTYNVVLRKLLETEVLDGLRSEIISILEYATPPKAPFAPKVGMNILFSLLFSFFVSIGFVILKEYLDTSIRNPDDIEQLGLPILSMVPHVAEGANKSAAREAFNTLRTALMFSRGDRQSFRILVTSSVPKEGKTSVATNTAKTLSMAGDSVLLVDCDLRRPMVHNRFNVDRRLGGITSYMMHADDKPVETYIQNVAPNLDILPCGPIPPDPMKVLSMPKMKDLMNDMSERYRWVIIDSPPVIGLSDAVLLSRLVDGICLVMRRNSVDKVAAEHAAKSLRDMKGNVLGVVFNDVDFRSAYYTRYYQYGGYYYYYSSSEEKSREDMFPLVEQIRRRKRKAQDGGDQQSSPPAVGA